MVRISETLDNIIKNNKVVIFSMNNCPFCMVAKNTIEKHTTVYHEETYKPAYHDWIVAKTDRSSLPAVFINGVYIGGCNDGGIGGVSTLDRLGFLKQLVDSKKE